MKIRQINPVLGMLVVPLTIILVLTVMADAVRTTSLQAAPQVIGVTPIIGVTPTIVMHTPCPTPPVDQANGDPRKTELGCNSVYREQGRIIASGTNNVPITHFELKSYRLEEVVLPGLITCEVEAPVPGGGGDFRWQTLTFDKVWRFTITSEKRLHHTPSPYWLYLDNTPVGAAYYVADGQLVSIIYDREYDRSLLQEGATIGVSYPFRDGPEVTLPEKLHFISP